MLIPIDRRLYENGQMKAFKEWQAVHKMLTEKISSVFQKDSFMFVKSKNKQQGIIIKNQPQLHKIISVTPSTTA